jgi:hypothetical protein
MHLDHECIPVRLDVEAIRQALILIESGIRQEQMAWIQHGKEQIEIQIDRAVSLAGKGGKIGK